MLGSSFKVDRVFLMYLLFEFCFNWLSLAGVRKYLRNHCPLAANFGTKACRFAVRGLILHKWIILLGGDTLYIFSCQTLFSSVVEIFSVVKLENFLVAVDAYYVAFMRSLSWVEKYTNIWHEFCFDFPDVGLVGRNRVLFYYCFFWLSFSWRTCIFLVLGEQRHLLLCFWINICPFRWISKRCAFFLIRRCLVSV